MVLELDANKQRLFSGGSCGYRLPSYVASYVKITLCDVEVLPCYVKMSTISAMGNLLAKGRKTLDSLGKPFVL